MANDEGGVSEIDYKNAREYVLSTYSSVKEYEFDKENELWCKLTFDVSNFEKGLSAELNGCLIVSSWQ